MPLRFSFTVSSTEAVKELPGYWTPERLNELLQRLEFEKGEDVAEDQLREYAVMALQDLDCADAARALLDLTLASRLSSGKLQNISEEMQTERLWEEYPDLSCHEPIFNAQVLLSEAFASAQAPEVNLVKAALVPVDAATETYLKEMLARGTLPEPLIVRCMAAASPDNSILNRLFEDQIKGQPFTEAEHLVWHVETTPRPATTHSRQGVSLSLFSPLRWTDSLEEGKTAECVPAALK